MAAADSAEQPAPAPFADAPPPPTRHLARFAWTPALLAEAAAAGRRRAAVAPGVTFVVRLGVAALGLLLLGAGVRVVQGWPQTFSDVLWMLTPLGVAAAGVGVIVALLRGVVWPALHRRELATAPALQGVTVMTLDARGVTIESPGGVQFAPWDEVETVERSAKALAFWTRRAVVILFPADGADAPLHVIERHVDAWRAGDDAESAARPRDAG